MNARESWGRSWWSSWRRAGLLAAGLLVVLGVVCRIALAEDGTPSEQTGQPPQTPGRADEAGPIQLPLTPRREKLDGALAALAETAAAAGDAAALAAAQAAGLGVSNGMVRVLVESAAPDLTNARAAILAAGGTVESEYADTIQALVPPGGLDQLAASPDVRYVRTPAGRAPDGAPAPGRAR